MIEAARRVLPDYARHHAREFYGDGVSTVMSETIGSATASSSNAVPSRMQTPLPQPAPAPIRPATGKPVVKFGTNCHIRI
eukprot:7863054-Lingulodinium_polyedra.AAC.1